MVQPVSIISSLGFQNQNIVTQIFEEKLILENKGCKIIDFKLIGADKVIILFGKYLAVIDTNTKE